MSNTFRIGATLSALAACVLLNGVAHAQSASLTGASYQENFDGIGQGNVSVSDASLPVPGLISNKDQFTASTGSSGTGTLYNFGSGTGNALLDRAPGSVASGTTGNILFGLVIRNNTGATITNFNLSYTGEQYRNGGVTATQKLDFSYIVSDTLAISNDFVAAPANGSYTDVDTLDFTSPITGTTAGALNGNLAANRRNLSATSLTTVNATSSPSGWLNGQYLYLRWTDTDDTGNDHGLAIDDVNLSVQIPEPGTFALALLGVGSLGVMAVRRRRAMRN